jgi:hypothetical protein
MKDVDKKILREAAAQVGAAADRTWTELIHRVYAGCLASGCLAPFHRQVHRLDRIFACRERTCRPVPG